MVWTAGAAGFYDLYIQPGIDNCPVFLGSALVCWILADLIFPYSGLLIPQYDKLTERQKIEWNGRLVAMVHALFAITLVPGYIWIPENLTRIDNVTGLKVVNHYGYDAYTQFIYCVSVGYFLWDSVVCIQYQWGFEYIMHGVLCFFVYYINLFPFLHYWGRFYLGAFELSSIPLHFRGCMIMLRWNKIEEHPDKFKYFMLAQNTWVAIYTVCRILIGTHTTYVFLQDMFALLASGLYHSRLVVYLNIVVLALMMLLMYYWMYQIIMGLLARGRQNDRRNNEDNDVDADKRNASEKKNA